MRIDILSVLPGVLNGYLMEGMLGRAIREGRLRVNVVNPRDYADDRHKTVDDYPYGGGPGLLMKVAPLARAMRSLGLKPGSHTVFMTPQGKPFVAEDARRLAGLRHLVLVCGRYEGIDQRFRDAFVDEELSIGDYVLTGGELPALVVLDALARFVPGVLGNEQSASCDSFSDGLLEGPQYTKPAEFEGMRVPDVLLSGDHGKIAAWRREQSLLRTQSVRPDLEPEAVKRAEKAPGKKVRKKT